MSRATGQPELAMTAGVRGFSPATTHMRSPVPMPMLQLDRRLNRPQRTQPGLSLAQRPRLSLSPTLTRCTIADVDDELDESVSSEADAKQKEIERLRAAETFFKKGTGDYECTQCQFVYNTEMGDPEAMVMKGTPFADVPDDWLCPVCGSPKEAFEEQGKIVAGFAENQGYGFGTNTLTEGQKSALIYGSLVFFFFLFLLGYKMN
eukprot:CAMPEP_0197516466 /NCGR_PEP_ID=MMETSP1318-20131121/1339_1 /TAXON_ID=552666 /ORGANISM="Partenskyella glossopodia, Strain RCC365" /LENGTH=204 /DNA_ID=CAMNT_0043065221 /DNA_START=133 /DNA_END=747 /DNA_ORIENTATION=-